MRYELGDVMIRKLFMGFIYLTPQEDYAKVRKQVHL